MRPIYRITIVLRQARKPKLLARMQLSQEDYRTRAGFGYLVRHSLELSQAAKNKDALTTRQCQVLLAIKGLPRDEHPTAGDLAEQLCIQHLSAVELVNRLSEAKPIRRRHEAGSGKQVQIAPTAPKIDAWPDFQQPNLKSFVAYVQHGCKSSSRSAPPRWRRLAQKYRYGEHSTPPL